MACLLSIALHFGHIKDTGFPFGIGGYMLRYKELAEKEGKYHIENNQVFFDKFKLVGTQLVMSLDEIMKMYE